MASPVQAQSGGNLFDNIFKPPAPVQPQSDPLADAQSELVVRVERLESQLRMLTGQIEQLQFRNQQLETQLRALEEGRTPARTPAAGAAPASPAAAAPGLAPVPIAPRAAAAPPAGRRADAFDPAEGSAAPGAPQPLGSPASSSAGLVRPPIGPIDAAPVAGAGVATGAASSGSAKDLFDLGYGYVQRQDYANADQTLRQFIQTYPTDRLIPEATYFLGESQFQRQIYKDAAENFLHVSTKFPNAPRAPEALLRLGQSLAALNEREAACATLGEVDRKYPRASSTVRQAVEREQKRVGC